MDPTYRLFTGEEYSSPKSYKLDKRVTKFKGKVSPNLPKLSSRVKGRQDLAIDLSPDSIVAANIDALFGILPHITPKVDSIKYKVVEQHINGSGIADYLKWRGGSKLSDSFTSSANYNLIYSHSTNILDGWNLLNKLPSYANQIVVIPSVFSSEGDFLDFAYTLANISVNFYAAKLFTVENEDIVHFIVRGVNLDALNAVQNELMSTERFSDIEELLNIAKKKKVRDFKAEKAMRVMSDTPYSITYSDIPNSFIQYITPIQYDIENIDPSILWYIWDLPSPHPQVEYVMKGGCVGQRFVKEPSYDRSKVQYNIARYVNSKTKITYESLVIKYDLIAKWRSLLNTVELGDLLLSQRLLDTKPISDLLPSSLKSWNGERVKELQQMLTESLQLTQKENLYPKSLVEGKNVIIKIDTLPDMVIPIDIFNTLEFKYKGDKKQLLLSIYNTFTNYSIIEDAAISPPVKASVINYLRMGYTSVIDVMSSPLNTDTKKYYSLFDSDELFGSSGNPLSEYNVNSILSNTGVFFFNIPTTEAYSVALGKIINSLVNSRSNWVMVVALVHGRDIASISKDCKQTAVIKNYNQGLDLTVMVGYNSLAAKDVDDNIIQDIVSVLSEQEDEYTKFLLAQPSNLVRDIMQDWINKTGPGLEFLDELMDLDLFSIAKDYLDEMDEPDEWNIDRTNLNIQNRLLLFKLFPNNNKYSNTIVNSWYNKIHFKELNNPKQSLITLYDQFNKYLDMATEKELRELVEAFTL